MTVVSAKLTAREAEVLALLRDRLTNTEIAEQLVVSVRTVESHVSALLRKLGVADRRALARVAGPSAAPPRVAGPVLPVPLTPFVGRVRELDALADAVRGARLTTATGPGGVGKTRLALAAAHRLSGEYEDGAVFVDLVRVVDPAMVTAAVADAVGVPERAGVNREQALLGALAGRDQLLIVDNCEHVADGVRPCVERLLTACPRIRVLATSRIRLMLPYESVFAVPGLSVDDAGSDAVELFVARMVAGGGHRPSARDRQVVRDVCRALDGIALAIELAAARAPAIGLDGLAGAIDAHVPLLAVEYRAAHRHRSLRATIDWSYALLDDDERATLRAAATFAALFDTASLATVLGRPRTATLAVLGRLVDWNLVAPRRGPVTRYRMLETIRQYATAVADESGDGDRLRDAHREWVRDRLRALLASAADSDVWRADVDAVLDDARAALRRADAVPARHAAAVELAELIAGVTFRRGRPGEAQQRYEQAAGRAASPADRVRFLRWASGAAACRNVGAEAVDLLRRAADEAADPDDAAEHLALAAMYLNRCRGIIGRPIGPDEPESLLTEAREAAARGTPAREAAARGTPAREAARRGAPARGSAGLRAAAAIAMAEGWSPEATARSAAHTDRALALARDTGDPLLQSMVLDQLTVVGMGDWDLDAALGAIRTRLDVLAGLPVTAHTGFEIYDAAHMASHLFLAAGDLAEARRHADTVATLPFFREEEHIGLARRVEVDVLAGQFHTVAEYGERMERGWARAGRPVAGNLAVSAYGVAAAHGMLGDTAAEAHWTAITESLLGAYPEEFRRRVGWRPTLAAYVDLHRGDAERALARLGVAPDDDGGWQNPNLAMWRSWYAAFWAEASVLAGHPDAAGRLRRATRLVRGNPIAAAIVERGAALHRGDAGSLPALAARLAAAGSPYQRDRTDDLAQLFPDDTEDR